MTNDTHPDDPKLIRFLQEAGIKISDQPTPQEVWEIIDSAQHPVRPALVSLALHLTAQQHECSAQKR